MITHKQINIKIQASLSTPWEQVRMQEELVNELKPGDKLTPIDPLPCWNKRQQRIREALPDSCVVLEVEGDTLTVQTKTGSEMRLGKEWFKQTK